MASLKSLLLSIMVAKESEGIKNRRILYILKYYYAKSLL